MSSDKTPDAGAAGAADADCGCDEVIRDVWLFLDDEMNPQRRAVVQQHIDDCSPCLAEAGFDAALKSLLARKCGGDKAPEALKVRVLSALRMSATTSIAEGSVTVTRTVVRESIETFGPDRLD